MEVKVFNRSSVVVSFCDLKSWKITKCWVQIVLFLATPTFWKFPTLYIKISGPWQCRPIKIIVQICIISSLRPIKNAIFMQDCRDLRKLTFHILAFCSRWGRFRLVSKQKHVFRKSSTTGNCICDHDQNHNHENQKSLLDRDFRKNVWR